MKFRCHGCGKEVDDTITTFLFDESDIFCSECTTIETCEQCDEEFKEKDVRVIVKDDAGMRAWHRRCCVWKDDLFDHFIEIIQVEDVTNNG